MAAMRSAEASGARGGVPGAGEATRRGFEDGRREYGDLPITFAAFEAHVAASGTRHWRAQDLDPTPARLAEHAESAALRDLYLAAACESGSDRAWLTLSERLKTRLEGFAVRRGLASAEAEERVQDLLGDLASPPPRAATRTLLGTYDGSGSLFGWLCVVLLRRIAGAARSRKSTSLEAQPPEAVETATPLGAAAPGEDPATLSAETEATARLEKEIAAAWGTLSPQEQLALLFKHRDGLPQTRIAALLGVGEPRVSRVVSAAVGKIQERLRGLAEDRPGPGWVDVVSRLLARSAPPARPSSGADPARPDPPRRNPGVGGRSG